MKKIILVVVALIALALGWYLLSPLWRTVRLDESSPLQPSATPQPSAPPQVRDQFEKMNTSTRAEFKWQMEAMKGVVRKMADAMPSAVRQVAAGNFLPRAHEVQGRALLIEDGGKEILRLENFKTINGPNLHIWLAADLSDRDYVDLGKIKATEGNVNYAVGSTVDTDKYNKVLVWCVPFRVLFSYAELQAAAR